MSPYSYRSYRPGPSPPPQITIDPEEYQSVKSLTWTVTAEPDGRQDE
jgi:hypothetical protein